MKFIRNAAKAVIIQDDQILLTKNEDREGYYYLFPGGGQEKTEVLKDTIIRECLEEVGCKVNVKDILFIREYVGKNHEHAEWDHDLHQVEFYFECTIETPIIVSQATNLDNDQVGVEWVDISKLNEIRMYPKGLTEIIMNKIAKPCYVGDMN